MTQTIGLIQNGKYPFDQIFTNKNLVKVQDIRTYNSLQQVRQQKLKMQTLFSANDKGSQTTVSQSQNVHLIKLLKIYQQNLTLHFIYEYVPYSLDQFIQKRLYGQFNMQKSYILEMNSKLFIKKVCYQLSSIINFLIKGGIKLDLSYEQLGIDQQQNLKLFIDPSCQLLTSQSKRKQYDDGQFPSKQTQNQLKGFYQWKKRQILSKLQGQFKKLKQKQQYVPNFIIKGNQLIFCKPPSDFQSQRHSTGSFTENSFTGRCESLSNNHSIDQGQNIRKTQGNLFEKLKKTEGHGYVTESSKKLQQNMQKLQYLRQKSKKLNQQLRQTYLSRSQNVTSKPKTKDYRQQSKERGPNCSSQLFNKKMQNQKQQETWRNSQIPSNLGKTHLPGGGQKGKSPNLFGANFDGERSKSNRNHKNSFQFNQNNRERNRFNPNKSYDKGYAQGYQEKSFQQTKSFRIELEQTTRNKQRKDSYKVKILTCQQMQLDGDNIEQFVFNAMNRNFNAQKNQNNRQEEESYSNRSQYGQQQNGSDSSKYRNKFQNIFPEEQVNSQFSESPIKSHVRQRQRESSSPKNMFEKYCKQLGDQNEKSNKNQKLQEKIKLAKEKAQNILNKYMKTKKYCNTTSTSKLGN